MSKKSNSLLIIAVMLFSIFSPVTTSAINVDNGTIVSGDLQYEWVNDHYKITDTKSGTVTNFGFAITGTYNNNSFLKATPYFTWNTPSISSDAVTLTESSNSWIMENDFSSGNDKITNYVTNNYPNSIIDAEFYYILTVEEGDIIKAANQAFVVSDENKHWSSDDYDLNSIASTIELRGITFNYQDIIDDGFDILDIYVTDGSLLGYDNQMVVAIGFTTGNGIIASGQTVVIDPTIEDGVFGYMQTTVNNANLSTYVYTATEDADSLTFSVDVPDGDEIEEGNLSTYPGGMVWGSVFNGSSSALVGTNGIDTNVSYNSVGEAVYNGIDSRTVVLSSSSYNQIDNITVYINMTASDDIVSDQDFLGVYSAGDEYSWRLYIYNYELIWFIVDSDANIHQFTKTISPNQTFTAGFTFDNNAVIPYFDGVAIDYEITGASLKYADAQLNIGRVNRYTEYTKCNVSDIYIFNSSDSSIMTNIVTGYSGASIKQNSNIYQPIQSGTLTFTNVSAGDTFTFATTETDLYDVTITALYIDDITLIDESLSGTDWSANINHTAGTNYTNANILFTPSYSPLYSLSMDSTNTNASYVYSGGVINITTGLLNVDDNFFYNFTGTTEQTMLAAPENLIATPDIDHVHLEWDIVSGADNYSVCIPLPAMYNLSYEGITPPPTDGTFNQTIANFSQNGILRSPNPIDSLTYERIYAVHDENYIYMGANTYDNDANALDDRIGVYIDVLQDGLTTDDRGWQIREDGTLTYIRWSGTAWINAGITGASAAVTGSGTTNPQYTLQIPKSELVGIADGNHIDLIVRRTNTDGATTYTFFPDSTGYTILTTYGWQDLYMSPYDTPEGLYCQYTTDNFFNATGLDSYSEYTFIVGGMFEGITGNSSIIKAVTLDYPKYIISGTVYNYNTGSPVPFATVVVDDTFTYAFTICDSNGNFTVYNLHDDDYLLTTTHDYYGEGSLYVTVDGYNITEQEIIMYPDASGEVTLISTYNLLIVILAACFYMSFPPRGQLIQRDTGVINWLCALIGMLLSRILASTAIDGTLSIDGIFTVYSATQSYMFSVVTFIFLILFVLDLKLYIEQRRISDNDE